MAMLEQTTIDTKEYRELMLIVGRYRMALRTVQSLIDTALECNLDAPAMAIKQTVDRALEQAE